MSTWEDTVETIPMEPLTLRGVLGRLRLVREGMLHLIGYVPCETCMRMISPKQAFFDFGECRECAYVTKTKEMTQSTTWSEDATREARSQAFWVRELRDLKV